MAYDALRQDILSGVRAPSEKLGIDRLRTLYRIGPTPLREALQRLAADGMVIATGNRGFIVAPLHAAEFQDLNLARTVVEKEAIRLSIQNGDGEWEASVVAAAYRLTKLDATLQTEKPCSMEEWEAANRDFHFATVRACGSSWLLRVRKLLHDQCERYRRTSVSIRRQTRDLKAEHQAIADAVVNRNADLAAELVERHFDVTTKVLVDELKAAMHGPRHGQRANRIPAHPDRTSRSLG
jgi:DNA-binding GntR family transcriptional regulator